MDGHQMDSMYEMMRRYALQFIHNLGNQYKCVICKHILIDACVTGCGCRFCKLCIMDYLRQAPTKCPGTSDLCDEQLLHSTNDVFPCDAINRKISRLVIKCPNNGCQSQPELSLIGDHLNICQYGPQNCPYTIVGCQQDKLTHDAINQHFSLDYYSHSQLLMNYISESRREIDSLKQQMEKLQSDHEMEKHKWIKDNQNIKQKMNMEMDLFKKETEEIIKMLRRENVETKDEMKAENLKQKQDLDHAKHAIQSLVSKEVQNKIEIDNLKDEICALKNTNRLIKETIDAQIENQQNTNQQIDELNQRCHNISQSTGNEIRRQMAEMAEMVEMSHRDSAAQFNEAVQRMDAIETASNAKIAQLVTNMRISMQSMEWGEYLWTIDNWNDKCKQIQEKIGWIRISSEEFYTNYEGFKMCLDATIFESRNLCCGFSICAGKFDDNLSWPFDQSVEISIIDLKTGLARETETVKCGNYPNDSRFQKPQNGERNDFYYFDVFFIIPENPHLSLYNKVILKCIIKPKNQ